MNDKTSAITFIFTQHNVRGAKEGISCPPSTGYGKGDILIIPKKYFNSPDQIAELVRVSS